MSIDIDYDIGDDVAYVDGERYVREEIVRCRDCEHAQVRHPLNPITGILAGIEDWRCDYFWNADELPEVEPDGFCAWGERRKVVDE